jgi:hypothetical protein
VRRLVPFVLLAALAAGCGARSSTPYTAQGTRECLTKQKFKHVTTNPAKVGFIAGFAANGGLKATSPDGNVVTIAFTDSADAVQPTENAFKLHAPKKLRPHIGDVMHTNRNAVIVWTTTPSSDAESAVDGCLAS